MGIEKILQYECKVCGRRIDVTRTGDVYEEPVYCCSIEATDISAPEQKGAASSTGRKPAPRKKSAKKKAAKKAVKKPAAKKAAKKTVKKITAQKKATVKKAAKKKAKKTTKKKK